MSEDESCAIKIREIEILQFNKLVEDAMKGKRSVFDTIHSDINRTQAQKSHDSSILRKLIKFEVEESKGLLDLVKKEKENRDYLASGDDLEMMIEECNNELEAIRLYREGKRA